MIFSAEFINEIFFTALSGTFDSSHGILVMRRAGRDAPLYTLMYRRMFQKLLEHSIKSNIVISGQIFLIKPIVLNE